MRFKPQCLVVSALSVSFFPSGLLASALSDAAGQIQPGQSIKLPTTLTGQLLSPEGSDIIQWGNSGVWDPVRREVRFIGKRHSQYPYHFLVYDESSNSWSLDRSIPGFGSLGHGYDSNTVDPATGDHYFRPYNSETVYKWDGGWSSLPTMPNGPMEVANTISWVPSLGLVYQDTDRFDYFDGSSWRQVASAPNSGLHNVSEYNVNAEVLIYGGGDNNSSMWKYDSQGNVSSISRPPFTMGAAPSQGVLVADPSSDAFVAWRKESRNWTEYKVSTDTWTTLTPSTGNGSAPQQGTPNLSSDLEGDSTIGIPINTYGVVMFIQFRGQSSNADVWLYRHAVSSIKTPEEPVSLVVE